MIKKVVQKNPANLINKSQKDTDVNSEKLYCVHIILWQSRLSIEQS